MKTFRYATADVFAAAPFTGNPVAVVLNADGLSSAQMQALAVEFNYVEATFVLSPDDGRQTARVRIFTPDREVPFAGHPNIGTAFLLAQAEITAGGQPSRRLDRSANHPAAGGGGRRFREAAGVSAPEPLDFFYDEGSCSLAVRILLEEMQTPYRAHRVTARAEGDAATQPAWGARNPKGRVRALTPVAGRGSGEQLLLTEAPAVLTYVARLRPELDLAPRDPAREARVIEWTNWISGWVQAVGFGGLWRPGRFTDDEAARATVAAKAEHNLRDAFALIEQALAGGRVWAAPRGYTLVDPYLLVFHRWAADLDMLGETCPRWTALAARTLERPAVQRALALDGLSG